MPIVRYRIRYRGGGAHGYDTVTPILGIVKEVIEGARMSFNELPSQNQDWAFMCNYFAL